MRSPMGCLLLILAGVAVAVPGEALAAGSRGVGVKVSHTSFHARDAASRHHAAAVRHHRFHRASGLGYAPALPEEEGFLSYPAGYMRGDEVPLTRRSPSPAPDPNSFDGMRVMAGIAPAPTPEPTLHRLVGPRDRPATRVIRIAQDAPGRHRHAETGALLLVVPPR